MADEDFIVRLELDVRDARASAEQLANVLARLNKEIDSPELTKAERNLGKFAGQEREAAKAAESHAQSLSTTRYALYDVSRTLGIAGAAMIALGVATYGTAIAFERDFANVIRTSGVSGSAIGALRDDLIELAQTIPLSFGEITAIATLGGQLGIASNQLANFTSVVAQFSATTNVTVDQAATAFGRLNSLLPDVQGNFTALGSSILRVGVNSVATEAQIVKTATQISAIGTNAGLTAAEVIGLAGAFASIGVAPELTRGTLVRTFSLIGKAASEGGDKLDAFAEIAGVSSSELADAYGTDKFGPIFQQFLGGLNDISQSGGDLNSTLAELGINSVRDRPALINLATAMDSVGESGGLVAQTIADANGGFAEQTDLAEQYGIIAGTVSAKLTILANNFQVFLDALGSGSTGPIATVVDGLSQLLQVATDLVSNPVGQWVAGVVLALGTLIGVLLTVAAAGVAGAAGIIGMQQALVGLGVPLVGTQVGLAGLTAQLAGAGTAGRVAALGVNALSTAMKGLALVAAVAISFEGFKGVTNITSDVSEGIRGINRDLDTTIDRLGSTEGLFDEGFGSFLIDATGGLRDLGIMTDTVSRDLEQADEAITNFINAGDTASANSALKRIADEQGISIDKVLTKLPGARAAMEAYGGTAAIAADQTAELAEAEDAAAIASELFADRLNLSVEGLEQLVSNLSSGSAQFTGFDTILGVSQANSQAWAEQQAAGTQDSKDSWQDFYDGASVNIFDFMAILDQQIADQENWATNIAILTARGAGNFAAELAKLGPEGASLAAQAVAATGDELDGFEARAERAALVGSEAFQNQLLLAGPLLADAAAKGGDAAVQALQDALISGSPAAVAAVVRDFNLRTDQLPIIFKTDVNTETAQQRIDRLIADNNGKRINLVGTYSPPSARQIENGYASGGHIRGPGTGTSDSIPARLSNGEYVIRAASVRQYGTGLFDSLNRGVKKFASGGPVGYASGGSVPSGGGGMTVVELSSYDRALLARIPEGLRVDIDGKTIARATNASNTASAQRGSN